jgi:hypothetical protein
VAATITICRTPRTRNAGTESEIERLRQRLRAMSDPELLLFGVTTKYQCSWETEPDHPPPENVIVQLSEARREWKRRNPRLPLSESF